MAKGYVRFALSSGTIGMTFGLKSTKSIELPDGGHILRVEFYNGNDLIVTTGPKLPYDDDYEWFIQKFWIFDEHFEVVYQYRFDLVFRVFESSKDHYIFYVDKQSGGGNINEAMGILRLNKGWGNSWEGKPLSDKWSRHQYVKALMLRG